MYVYYSRHLFCTVLMIEQPCACSNLSRRGLLDILICNGQSLHRSFETLLIKDNKVNANKLWFVCLLTFLRLHHRPSKEHQSTQVSHVRFCEVRHCQVLKCQVVRFQRAGDRVCSKCDRVYSAAVPMSSFWAVH